MRSIRVEDHVRPNGGIIPSIRTGVCRADQLVLPAAAVDATEAMLKLAKCRSGSRRGLQAGPLLEESAIAVLPHDRHQNPHHQIAVQVALLCIFAAGLFGACLARSEALELTGRTASFTPTHGFMPGGRWRLECLRWTRWQTDRGRGCPCRRWRRGSPSVPARGRSGACCRRPGCL